VIYLIFIALVDTHSISPDECFCIRPPDSFKGVVKIWLDCHSKVIHQDRGERTICTPDIGHGYVRWGVCHVNSGKRYVKRVAGFSGLEHYEPNAVAMADSIVTITADILGTCQLLRCL
jgi:hypothetical protein